MLNQWLANWTRFVTRNAKAVLTVIAIITMIAAAIAVSQFSMNSDTSRLIRQETEWKAVHDEFIQAFPQYDQNTIVVLSGPRPNALISATRALSNELTQRSDVFESVFSPAASDFVDRNALLFLETDQLADTVSTLSDAQPFLQAIADHDSLMGVMTLLIDALESGESLPEGFVQMSDALDLAVDRAISGSTDPIAWRDELFQVDGDDTYYQIILVQGVKNFGVDLPNRVLIEELRAIIDQFEHPQRSEIEIRVTGRIPLDHGEIVSALESAQLAGTLAMILLIAVLVWGVRSARIIAATYLSMICGLIWTAALATFTVGQYNTISIIFLVMFIGLGVDFAVHLCLKYQESLVGQDKSAALLETNRDLGSAIMLCGVTSAIGFLAFVPTDYIGLAEMGIISGGGMIIAVIVSLTLIPAFFAVTKAPAAPYPMPLADALSSVVAERPKTTAYVTLLLAAVLTGIGSGAQFDYSTLSLKDPDSEAMTTLAEMHEQDIVTEYALTYMAGSLQEAESQRAAVEALPQVAEYQTPTDFLPEDQEEKQYILEDAEFLLEGVFNATSTNDGYSDDDFVSHLNQLNQLIADRNEADSAEVRAALLRLQNAFAKLAAAEPKTRSLITELTVPPLKAEITWLGDALVPREITLQDLPPDMLARLMNDEGQAVVSIIPAEDVRPVEVMRDFAQSVNQVLPKATGRPVIDLGIGDIVIVAFFTAISLAVLSIFVVLLVTLRSVVDSILVFIPLAMTAMLTLTVSVLIDLPLNMANIVVIPLIFGLGVDNGIHMVKRFHQTEDLTNLVRSSTPKAVLLSNLTTLGTFCALSFSSHQGIYSIGVLLTVAIASLMLLTLISLPALLATFSRRQPV